MFIKTTFVECDRWGHEIEGTKWSKTEWETPLGAISRIYGLVTNKNAHAWGENEYRYEVFTDAEWPIGEGTYIAATVVFEDEEA